jgi:hypothetical protein
VTLRTLAGCLAAAALLLAPASHAGVRIELRSTSSGGKDAKPTSARYQVFVDGESLAVELARRDGTPATRRVVFRGGEDVAWLVDHKRRTYYQVDPKSAAQAASQVSGLRQGLEEGLGSLSPDQRAAVQDLLGELAKPAPVELPEYRLRERGELARYAEIACAQHDVLEGEKVVAEVCLADYGKPPLVREQLAAVPKLGVFLRRTLEPLAREFPSLLPLAPWAALDAVQGLPLRMRSVADDGATSETTVTRIEAAPVDPALFALPAGYARSWIPPFR